MKNSNARKDPTVLKTSQNFKVNLIIIVSTLKTYVCNSRKIRQKLCTQKKNYGCYKQKKILRTKKMMLFPTWSNIRSLTLSCLNITKKMGAVKIGAPRDAFLAPFLFRNLIINSSYMVHLEPRCGRQYILGQIFN